MISFPNAKINLGLNVIGKRSDGYHDLITVMYPVPLYDVLEFLPSPALELKLHGKKLEGALDQNLVFKAYHLLRSEYNLPSVTIHLLKKIPLGSGLGGGSSDGTFMLKMLVRYFKLPVSKGEMKKMALKIGSDCPFFVENIPALVSGRGDKIEPLSFSLKGFYLVLLFPDHFISTAKAYDQIVARPGLTDIKELVLSKDFDLWRKYLINDFEKLMPEKILALKNELYSAGALYASLSGSGSAIYGIFQKKPEKYFHRADAKVLECI